MMILKFIPILFFSQYVMTNPFCLSTVPCVPMNVSVVMGCASSTAVVSWSPSLGALLYSVTAHSHYSNVSCQTSDLNCTLYNLTCGNEYTVQVAAIGDNCSSFPSEALMFNSGKRGNTHQHIQYTVTVLYFSVLALSTQEHNS